MKFPTNQLVTAVYENLKRTSDACEGPKGGVETCENCQFSTAFIASPAKDLLVDIMTKELHPIVAASGANTIGFIAQIMFEIGLKCGQLQGQFDGDEEAAAVSLGPISAAA